LWSFCWFDSFAHCIYFFYCYLQDTPILLNYSKALRLLVQWRERELSKLRQEKYVNFWVAYLLKIASWEQFWMMHIITGEQQNQFLGEARNYSKLDSVSPSVNHQHRTFLIDDTSTWEAWTVVMPIIIILSFTAFHNSKCYFQLLLLTLIQSIISMNTISFQYKFSTFIWLPLSSHHTTLEIWE
jgi:hypothetical protein